MMKITGITLWAHVTFIFLIMTEATSKAESNKPVKDKPSIQNNSTPDGLSKADQPSSEQDKIDFPKPPMDIKEPTIEERLAQKRVQKGNAVFIRIFKRESQLELWMRRGPRFTLVKTYKICSWSGALGPKLKEGDHQSPEGFYYVTKGSLNPNSQYHLSFNLGFPNAYDRAHKRTGSYLMVHGECVSIGCYAMTNKNIEEIYGLVKAALHGKSRIVRVHIFPFRMNAANMDAALGHKWIDFWWNLKQGYDLFEARFLPPNVRICKKSYIFDPSPFNAGGIPNWTQTCK